MKNVFFILLFFGCSLSMHAQDAPEVGDVLVINETNTGNFRYVKFPKLNILIKRGQLGNYKSVYNTEVIVEDVITNEDGSTDVSLKQKNGAKFFGYLTTVKANYTKALDAKELAMVK
ncbi:MAG: hypothetical protein AB8B52_14050 [Winogradskyella sp.]|uniref:hypothetical protein n=1 Tax=Winogradskyella sp. TaxID=1883156 RepID=UPI00385FEE22